MSNAYDLPIHFAFNGVYYFHYIAIGTYSTPEHEVSREMGRMGSSSSVFPAYARQHIYQIGDW
jgi:hypothetical protein